MRPLSTAITLVLALGLGACVGPDLDREPYCQLGTGDVEFVPIDDGSEVGVVRGIQGGDHIWGSARVVGIDWTDVTLVFELLDDEGLPVTESSTLIGELNHCPMQDAGCARGMGETVGFPVIVEDVSDVVAHAITMKVTAVDAEGRTATHEVTVDPFREIE